MDILPPHRTCDIEMFYLTVCVLISIPVMPLAVLCNCVDVECLSSVLVGRIFLFVGFRCVHTCTYVFGRVLTFLAYLCVCFTVPQHIWFQLVRFFSGLPP